MAVADLPFAPRRATYRREARKEAFVSSALGAVDVGSKQDRVWTGNIRFADFTLASEVRKWSAFLSKLYPDGTDRGAFWAPLYAPGWEAGGAWMDVIALPNLDGSVHRFAMSDGSAGPAPGTLVEFRSKVQPDLSQVSIMSEPGTLIDPNVILARVPDGVEANWTSPRVRAIIINEDAMVLSQTSRHRAHSGAIDWVEDRGALLELLAPPDAGAVPRGTDEALQTEGGFDLCTEDGDTILV